MKAFILDSYGKNAALRLGDRPEPVVGDTDVLVEVHAAAVNLLDSKIRDGEFKPILPYRPPVVLGHDAAGVVVRVGSKVKRFKAGDEVYARPRDRRICTFAELIAIDEADVALKPVSLSMEEAASIPLVGLTVWIAMVLWPGVHVAPRHLWAVTWFGVLGSLLVSFMGVLTSIWAEKFDHAAAVTNFVIAPLTLLSGTF